MRPDFAFSVWTFLFLRFSAAGSVPSVPSLGDPWFSGCAPAFSGLSPDIPVYSEGGSADLDPGDCSARCQRGGCSVAAVSAGGCYCGNQGLLSCPSYNCPSSSSTPVPGQRVVLLPVGASKGKVALYQTRGPFLDRICLFVSPDMVFAGSTFTVHVSGSLAAPLDQSTGIFGVGQQDFSDVTVEFLGMTPKGQSSFHVNILDQGSFNVSSNWSLGSPGTYEIRVIAFNIISMITATYNVSVLAAGCNGGVDSEFPGVCNWCLTQGKEMCCPKSICINMQNKTVKIKREKEKRDLTQIVVEVYAANQAYTTNTEVNFSALTNAQDSMEFLWRFGDSTSARNIDNIITKRYRSPGRYNVTVVMVTPRMSTTSEPFPIIIQRAVKLNRLIHQASVLQYHTVVFSCRVNTGTDLEFFWTFGDGSSKHGHSTEQHVFQSLGEFVVEVTVFNLVSSASLRSHIFVVDKPCQPPPVKNMGPLTIKVPRYEPVHLGVTYESEFNCDILVSRGVQYSWTLYNSMKQAVSLPHIETHKQTLIFPSHFLHYDTYTAVAKVQAVGSVVYSNYSVRLQVVETAPVVMIRGGTNVFINNKNTTVVTLDGTKSHDPDFPHNKARFSWICKPVSTIPSSCFDYEVPMSSAVTAFPSSFLKQNFDQFRFTLSIESAGRSALSEIFLTVKTDIQGIVSIECPQCQNNKVNWDQSFSIQAFCEQCKIPSSFINYSWSLYQVNASSRSINEVPFCHTVDVSAPSAITETPTDTSPSRRQWRSVLNPGPDSTMTRSGENLLYTLQELDPLDSSPVLSEYNGHVQEIMDLTESSSDWIFPFALSENADLQNGIDPHYDSFVNAEEGEPDRSPGRTTVEDGESFSLGEDLEFDPESHREEGSNLVDVRPLVVVQERTLLDLPRDPVPQWIFEFYTYAGIFSSELNFKPFSLQPGSRYMLEVTAAHDSQKLFLGRTQFFFQTKPAPKGMTCQVQPLTGVELLTVFSIFCSSGKEDLLYKYSYSVGNKPLQTLYQGTDFEHYFSLPVGDPTNDYKVTVSIEIRSSIDGGTTGPCPVSVNVQPQFTRDTYSASDPVLELSQIALQNLSSRLGNSLEILNYIRIVTDILNRLSMEPGVSMRSLVFLRNALVCIVCDIDAIDQFSMLDTIHVLKNLLQKTYQVSLAAISKVTSLMHLITNKQFVDQKTLNSRISLLAHNLKTVTGYNYQKDITNTATEMELSLYNLVGNNAISTINGCLTHTTGSMYGLSLAKHLVNSILRTVSLITLKFVALHKMEEFKLSAGSMSVYSTYQIQRTTVRSGFSVFYLPQSFVHHLDTCVISVVTELDQNPYFWASYPGELTGPVVELSLFRCKTRRKIPIQFFAEPFEIEVQPPEKQTAGAEYILQHNEINYHKFNISHEHLQHAIQLHVQFTPPDTRVFPLVLLFRMFAKPTPSEYHLHTTHHWERSEIHMTLPSSYLKAGGVGYLALLNVDFERPHRWRNTKVSYRVKVDRSQCVSWDAQKEVWTTDNCKTQTKDTSSAVNCSCHQMHPVTVVQEQMPTNLDTEETGAFFSVPYNWTVVIVLLLGMALFIRALVLSSNAGVASPERRVHYLSDNLLCEPHLYAVTINTGLGSAPEMSAKVYIVLCGEDGFTQTKELHVPGCTLFRKNSQDTFILSATKSLGSLCGIHIWHDNSGPTPTWYIKSVEVFELNRAHQGRVWLFDCQCWLAVDRSDGRVERLLRVYNQKMSFGKMLFLKMWDYMVDFHIWVSVYSCPNLISFTRCQRLSLCVLLWLGYTCVCTVIISQRNYKMHFELDVKEISMNAITTGILSVALVLPIATLLWFMFRLSQVKVMRLATKNTGETKTEDFDDAPSTNSISELYFSWSGLQQWLQESWRKKYQDTDLSSASNWALDYTILDEIQNNVTISKEDVIVIDGAAETQDSSLSRDKKKKENAIYKTKESSQEDPKMPQWFYCVAWVLWLLLCMICLASSAILGVRFTHREAVLWIQSLFFSLLFCIFFIHPLLVFTMALVVLMWRRKSTVILKISTHHMHKSIFKAIQNCALHPGYSTLLKVRQRQRFLRLVQPPSITELRNSRRNRKRDRLIQETVWDWFVFGSMLSLMLCVTYESSFTNYYNLNRAVEKHFISGQDSLMSVGTYDEWWRWAQTSLIDTLYKSTISATKFATFQNSHILIGEPVLWKTESILHEGLNSTLVPNCHEISLKNKKLLIHTCSDNLDDLKTSTKEAKTALGHTKTIAESKLKQLHSEHWIGKITKVLKAHFTLYSPAPNLFTSVTLTLKQSSFGVLLPSASVQSVQVFDTGSQWDYVVMTCKLLFLILLFLRLCHHILSLCEKGLFIFSKIPCNWLEVGIFVVAIGYYLYCIYRSVLVSQVAELLQIQNGKTHIDFRHLATWDQTIRSLRGTLLFLLTLRCVTLVKKTTPQTHFSCSLYWISIAGLIFVSALFPMRRLVGNIQRTVLNHGVIFVITRLMWIALVINVVFSSVKSLRRCRNIFTTTDLVQYIKKKLFSIWTQSANIDHNIERKTYYFEQFESVLDELLFRLDVLSDQTEVYREDSPISPGQDSFNTRVNKNNSEDRARDVLDLEMEQALTSSCLEKSGPDECNHHFPHREKGDEISEGIDLSNKMHLSEMKCDKNTEEREMDILKGQFTLTNLAKSAEVVVEVLVHKEQLIYDEL